MKVAPLTVVVLLSLVACCIASSVVESAEAECHRSEKIIYKDTKTHKMVVAESKGKADSLLKPIARASFKPSGVSHLHLVALLVLILIYYVFVF